MFEQKINTSLNQTEQCSFVTDNFDNDPMNLANLLSIYYTLNSYQSMNLINTILKLNDSSLSAHSLPALDVVDESQPDLTKSKDFLDLCSVFDQFDTQHIYESILNETVDCNSTTNVNKGNKKQQSTSNMKNDTLTANGFFVEDILKLHNSKARIKKVEGKDKNIPSNNNCDRNNNVLKTNANNDIDQLDKPGIENVIHNSDSTHFKTKESSSSSVTSDHSDSSNLQLPAWVFCTRYSDRPSSGPRIRKPRRNRIQEEDEISKRPRTSFTLSQLKRLSQEFDINRYLDEMRRKQLASELNLRESQVKIWFQNKRAKTKKASGKQNCLALHLIAEGLYNHSVKVNNTESEESETNSDR